jgi:hypothetical protein
VTSSQVVFCCFFFCFVFAFFLRFFFHFVRLKNDKNPGFSAFSCAFLPFRSVGVSRTRFNLYFSRYLRCLGGRGGKKENGACEDGRSDRADAAGRGETEAGASAMLDIKGVVDVDLRGVFAAELGINIALTRLGPQRNNIRAAGAASLAATLRVKMGR